MNSKFRKYRIAVVNCDHQWSMSPDHIPSSAAIIKNLENKLGRKLTSAEERDLYNKSTCILYETELHKKISRTYGTRNTTAQISSDASDLFTAAQKDMDAIRQSLISSGMSSNDVDKAFELIHEMNYNLGLY